VPMYEQTAERCAAEPKWLGFQHSQRQVTQQTDSDALQHLIPTPSAWVHRRDGDQTHHSFVPAKMAKFRTTCGPSHLWHFRVANRDRFMLVIFVRRPRASRARLLRTIKCNDHLPDALTGGGTSDFAFCNLRHVERHDPCSFLPMCDLALGTIAFGPTIWLAGAW